MNQNTRLPPWGKVGQQVVERDALPDPKLQITEILKLACPDLRQLLPQFDRQILNVRREHGIEYTNLIGNDDIILGDIVRNCGKQTPQSRGYVRAGPRRFIYHDGAEVIAGIVTCGGLCPGLNNVIRDLVRALILLYGVTTVYGFRGGYAGIYSADPVRLDLETVSLIHHQGGTILSSSRGGFDVVRILDALRLLGVNQLYVIGGDGTIRGAEKLYKATLDEAMHGGTPPITVVNIPKTIDNDIDLIDRSFGFNTAVEEALRAIRSARVEASCAPNGVGIVKLMGREAGFIAAHAALASGDVDLVLVPEVPITLEGHNSILTHMRRVIERSGHGVIVVAEGAGEEVVKRDVVAAGADPSGNKVLPPIGKWLKDRLVRYFKHPDQEADPDARQQHSIEVTVKYIDPSYMIRSVPANASDSLYCMLLAQNAVHGAMAGFTGFCTGLCNNRVVYLPMSAIVANSPRVMNATGRTWERVLSLTGQPKGKSRLNSCALSATSRTIF